MKHSTRCSDEISRLGANRIICLGDVVGYGPDSLACIRQSATWEVVLAGDWDLAMVNHDPSQWVPHLNEHIDWVRQQIRNASDADWLRQMLRAYQRTFNENRTHFVHATPDDFREWIFPEDIHDQEKLDRIATQFDRTCVCGHSQMQGIFRRFETWTYTEPVLNESHELDNRKTIVSVGSVGQPRDGDPRAAFITIDNSSVRFHRVEYDITSTLNKIRSAPDIDNMHGERLLFGR